MDISTPPNLSISLQHEFADADITEILKGASSPDIKAELTDMTKKAVEDLGAFGCPWFRVHDGKGSAEPFFGSARFHFIWDYLDIHTLYKFTSECGREALVIVRLCTITSLYLITPGPRLCTPCFKQGTEHNNAQAKPKTPPML